MTAPTWPVVAGVGYPDLSMRLTRGERLQLREALGKVIRRLRDEHGATVGISGMDVGFGTVLAETIVDNGLALWAYRPGPWQADKWSPAQRREWEILCGQAASVEDFSQSYSDAAYGLRDRGMLDVADVGVAWWEVDQRHGPVYQAVKYGVQRLGRPMVRLDPRVNRGQQVSTLPTEAAWYRLLGLEQHALVLS